MGEKKAKTWPELVAAMTDAELEEHIRKGNRAQLIEREVMVRLLRDRLQTQLAAADARRAAKFALSAADAANRAAALIGRLLKPGPRPPLRTRLRRALWPADLEIHGKEIHTTEGRIP